MSERTPLRARWYDDACGTALALDLLGERWALLVIRELMFGARRFGELRAGLPGISANVLTQRLEGLEREGLLTRNALPASSHAYELTAWGYECEPILQTMGRWAARSPAHDPTLHVSAATVMMSFRTLFDPRRSPGLVGTVGVQFPHDAFLLTFEAGTFQVARQETSTADLVVTCEPALLAALTYGGLPVDSAEASGHLRLQGSRALLRRALRSFVLPPKVQVP